MTSAVIGIGWRERCASRLWRSVTLGAHNTSVVPFANAAISTRQAFDRGDPGSVRRELVDPRD